MSKVRLKCAECGKEFTRNSWQVKGKHSFCSQACNCRWLNKNINKGELNPRSNRKTLKCEICGKEFTRQVSRIKRHKHYYCSIECRNNRWNGKRNPHWRGGKIKRTCEICGKTFYVKQKRIRMGYGHFCSKICSATAMLKKLAIEKPNKSELKLKKIIEQHKLPYRYTGDGSVWIGGKNPDFFNVNGQKQLIELFGEPWHPVSDVTEKINHYKKYGFECLIIWHNELKNEEELVKKLKDFSHRGDAKV